MIALMCVWLGRNSKTPSHRHTEREREKLKDGDGRAERESWHPPHLVIEDDAFVLVFVVAAFHCTYIV